MAAASSSGRDAEAQALNTSLGTPAELLVLHDVITRKTNKYIYDPLKRKKLAAGVPSFKQVQLDGVAALLAAQDTEDEDESEARSEPIPEAASAHGPPAQRKRECPDDSAAEHYATRRAARDIRLQQEKLRSEQYLTELRIREQLAQAYQWPPEFGAGLSQASHLAPPAAASPPVLPCSVEGATQTACNPLFGVPNFAEQRGENPAAWHATMHPTALAFLQSATEPLRYNTAPPGKGAKSKGGLAKGWGKSGKGFHNNQEICKEYHRKFGRCTYAERTGHPRGCKFYHASDEELRTAMDRLGSDSRYDLYDEVCLLLHERRRAGASVPRGIYAPAEM